MCDVHTGIDLIICDVPDNLPIPVVSPRDVLDWNAHGRAFVELFFVFTDANLHDNGLIMLTHGQDERLEKRLKTKAVGYKFRLVRKWVGGNRLKLASTNRTFPTVFTIHSLFPC